MKSNLFITGIISVFILGAVIFTNGQSPCEWKRITRISNKILNNPKIKRGIWEENDGKTQSLHFGADTGLKDIAFTDDKNGWIAGGSGIFLKTTNGGLSWTTKKLQSNFLGGVFFLDKQSGWAVGQNNRKITIYKTNDSGKNWVINQPIQNYEYSGLAQVRFINHQIGWVIGVAERPGSGTRVFKTADGGKSWKLQYSESSGEDGSSYFTDIEAIDENNVVIIGDQSLIKTSDSGKTWRKIYHSGIFNFADIEFVNETEGWVVGLESNVLHTTDGGENWAKQDIKAINTKWDIAYTAVKFINPQEGWITGWIRDLEKEDSSTDTFILRTKDSGKTWMVEKRGKDLILTKMTASSNATFAVGANGLILRRSIKGCS